MILDGHFSHEFVVKICTICLKRPDNKRKRGRGWPILKKIFKFYTTGFGYPPTPPPIDMKMEVSNSSSSASAAAEAWLVSFKRQIVFWETWAEQRERRGESETRKKEWGKNQGWKQRKKIQSFQVEGWGKNLLSKLNAKRRLLGEFVSKGKNNLRWMVA